MPKYNILDFGAKPDEKTINTKCIQAAIDRCAEGDEVIIPKGIFLTGALFLHGEMKLFLEHGAVLKGSSALDDYPPYTYRFEGEEETCFSSLINVTEGSHKNIEISGMGILDGSGMYLYRKEVTDGSASRGRVVCIRNTADCFVSGITICDSVSWTLQFIYCRNVRISDIKIFAKKTYDDERTNRCLRNGDGIVIDSCAGVEIDNCIIDSQDDCISIKSGKNLEGRLINVSSGNVYIHNDYFFGGAGISIGSEMSGGIEDVFIENCVYVNVLSMLSVKTNAQRGGWVNNINVRNCSLFNYDTSVKVKPGYKASIYFDANYRPSEDNEENLPIVKNIIFQNIHIFNRWGNLLFIRGIEKSHLQGIIFRNVESYAFDRGEITNAEVTFENVVNNGQLISTEDADMEDE